MVVFLDLLELCLWLLGSLFCDWRIEVLIESVIIENLVKRYHENRLSHAFLLETNDYDRCFRDIICFLKQINCPFSYSENCSNDCNLCNLFDSSNLPSLIEIEASGQFIKKEQILDMMEKFSTVPVYSKFNMYIIKEADRLNSSSANTLLKFLEEPEDNILGIFITNNKESVISTIRSRCQVFNVYYDINEDSLDEDVLLDVKVYLSSIFNNADDILYNKTKMSSLYSDRMEWDKFFRTMLFYVMGCYEKSRTDVIDVLKRLSSYKYIQIIMEIEEIMKYIKSNVNIDLILDKFVIEMRKFYE